MSAESRLEGKQRSLPIQREVFEKLQDCQRLGNKAVIPLVDFNGEIGYLGNQRLGNDGKLLLDLMLKQYMILLNDDSICIREYLDR